MPNPKDPEKLEAYRKKMSEIAKSKGYGKWMQGKKHSPESIEKMKQVQKEIGNDPDERQRRSERAKKKGYGKWMIGRKPSPETVAKRQRFRDGKTYVEIYGDRATEEAEKRKLSNRRRWIGKRKADLRPKHNSDHRYQDWRKAVFERDNYTCKKCFHRGGILHAHHIKEWAKFPDLRYEVDNGLTLCKKCHKESHN